MSYEQRARDYLDRFTEEPTWDVYSPDAQAALEALCESIAAEARATAIEEAADLRAFRCMCTSASYTMPCFQCGARRAIRAIAPRPGVRLVAREDLAKVIEAAETFVNNSSLVCVEIRKAINRLRAGEE